ncbi:MAG: hypothetical protein CM15mP77_0920 [Synechococcus sp.]|nr:MAG: hypothetical protein CM15mP77_0920 [Synechococcus sp.]
MAHPPKTHRPGERNGPCWTLDTPDHLHHDGPGDHHQKPQTLMAWGTSRG